MKKLVGYTTKNIELHGFSGTLKLINVGKCSYVYTTHNIAGKVVSHIETNHDSKIFVEISKDIIMINIMVISGQLFYETYILESEKVGEQK